MEGRTFFIKFKYTKKEFKPKVNICKAIDGSIICDKEEEVLAQWNEYFNDLLNRNNNQEHTAADGENIQLVGGPMVEKIDPPRLKNRK